MNRRMPLFLMCLLCLGGCATPPQTAAPAKYPLVTGTLADFIRDRPLGVFDLRDANPRVGEIIVVTTNQIYLTHEKDGVLSPYPWSNQYYRKELPSVVLV